MGANIFLAHPLWGAYDVLVQPIAVLRTGRKGEIGFTQESLHGSTHTTSTSTLDEGTNKALVCQHHHQCTWASACQSSKEAVEQRGCSERRGGHG